MFSDLERYERRVYSQSGEDGALARIFELIGTSNRFFVEFGAWDGLNLSNTAHLRLDHGWTGLLMEGSDRADDAPVEREHIDADNVNALFAKYAVPERFDLLSIDIDGNDYWVWKAIEGFTARVVVIEYNALFGNGVSKAMRYDAKHIWDKTPYHGASLAALRKLGQAKGYALIYTDSWAPNAFFVLRSELPADFVELPIEEVSRGEWFQEPPDTEHRDWIAV
jgi:hypothetical protein